MNKYILEDAARTAIRTTFADADANLFDSVKALSFDGMATCDSDPDASKGINLLTKCSQMILASRMRAMHPVWGKWLVDHTNLTVEKESGDVKKVTKGVAFSMKPECDIPDWSTYGRKKADPKVVMQGCATFGIFPHRTF